MAEITEIPSTEETTRGGAGGVKFVSSSKVNEEAEKLRARRDLPKIPGNVVRFKELQDWLGLLTTEMYDRLMIYVYRHDPVINRQFVDPKADNNIDVISGQGCQGLSEEYFIERHGGGVFGLTIKDTDVVKKNDRGYFEARLSINQTQHPPKLDYREVDWLNTKNKGYFAWARAQRIVDSEGKLSDPNAKDNNTATQTTGSNSQSDMVGMLKVVTEFASKLSDQQQKDIKGRMGVADDTKPITELLIAKMKEESPNNMLSFLGTLLPLMMKQNTPVAPTGDGGLAAMAGMMTTMMTAMMTSSQNTMTMMQESNKQTMVLFQSIIASQGKGEDDGEKFKQMVEIAKMIKGAPAAEESTTEKIVNKVVDMALPIANIVANMTGMKRDQLLGNGQGTLPPGGNTRANLAGLPVQNGIPENQRGGVGVAPSALPQPQQTTTTNADTPMVGVSPTDQTVINVIAQYGEMILNALNAGKEGWEFADNVAGVFGDIVVQTVAKHGTENLIKGMKLVPQFWGIIENSYGEPHMRKWCDEFINYKKIVAEMDSDGDGDGDNIVDESGEEGKVN